MYKDNQTIHNVKAEILNLKSELAKSISKTNNSKLRNGYLIIYARIKSILVEIDETSNTTNPFLNEIKQKALDIDCNTHGFTLHCSFYSNSDISKFVIFKNKSL